MNHSFELVEVTSTTCNSATDIFMPPDHDIQRLFDAVYGLNRDRSSGHEKPHKPVLILAALELIDRGLANGKQIPFNRNLREAFNRYFEVVKFGNDRPTIENPFFYLQSDGLWVVTIDGGRLETQVGVTVLESREAVGAFAPPFGQLLQSEFNREVLRDAIISRFFPQYRQLILGVAQPFTFDHEPELKVAETRVDYRVQRDSAFRKVVVEIYDYQCAACGIRIKLPPDSLTIVDAAHILPFSVSQNDHPSNGMALCKNHHWAMDRNLIAPGIDMRWHVSKRVIAERSSGEASLASLQGCQILPVRDPKFRPSLKALRWRQGQLASA